MLDAVDMCFVLSEELASSSSLSLSPSFFSPPPFSEECNAWNGSLLPKNLRFLAFPLFLYDSCLTRQGCDTASNIVI